MDYNNYKNRHIKNVGRMAGMDVSPAAGRYQYIVDINELQAALIESRADLDYALRKEAKRDRFILNTKAMEKEIQKTTEEVVQKVSREITETVSKDIVASVYASVASIGNINGARSHVKTANASKNNFGSELGRALGKAMVATVTKFWDEMNKD